VRGLLAGRYPVVVAAALAPLAVCLILVPFRRHVPNTSGALVLVLVVVAFAATGNRLAGVLAACSAALGFDLLLTRPFQRLDIASAVDIQTDLLLLAVGLAVTQIAHWGYRQQAEASRRAGYLSGIQEAARVASAGAASPSVFIGTVAERITALLGLSRCRFAYGTGRDHPRLDTDGKVRWHREQWDVDRRGLPTDKDTELYVESGGQFMGRYLLTAAPGARPSRAERLVAVALAAQVGAVLHAWDDTGPRG
jgi:K+-sensing histidine kinase KdpD